MQSYKIDFMSKTLIMTAAFEKALNDISSEEYKLYIQLQHDITGLKLSRRTHKTPSKYHTASGEVFRCNQYKHLTYKNMECFIKALPQSAELMKAYTYIKDCAALPQTSRYTAVRRWFMAQFPDIRKDPLAYLNNESLAIITSFTPFLCHVEEQETERAS